MIKAGKQIMNDPEIAINSIEAIIHAARRDLSIELRCALRTGLDSFIREIKNHVIDKYGDTHSYINENLSKIRWSVNASLGFTTTNSHDESQNRVFAYGSLGIVKTEMRRLFPELIGE